VTAHLPRWVSATLARPGTASFRRFEPVVRDAGRREQLIESLDDEALMAEAGADLTRARVPGAGFLAAARETMVRRLGIRPFDEQLLAACALVSGSGVELDTGEGKTLVAAIAAAAHAMRGRAVHVLSVNDYLAERDAEWMDPFFRALGVTVSWIGQLTPPKERSSAYRAQVVYVPVSEVGFDLLRDRFAVTDAERSSPVFDVAIVDEADAVMIDEAMVPLVLAGSTDSAAGEFELATALAASLVDGIHFTLDKELTTVALTDEGLDLLESRLGGVNLYTTEHADTLTRINLALHARMLVHRDVDYLVEDGTVKLVNSSRGRIAHRQRWPDGLHAAIEAKEALTETPPGRVLDTLTIHDLLSGYALLSGTSGTMVSVAEELAEFYSLPAGRIERHRPNIRVDEARRVFLTEEEKHDAIVSEVVTRHRAGQPVLVGTQSIAESEALAERLLRSGIAAEVLNAKNDAAEAAIIARAGEFGAVTISTQMSGRGTDIRLGGRDEATRDRVVEAGGLAVISAGSYPSRRLDAQLRGRAGRQGDPGASVSFDSLDSELVRANAPAYLLSEVDRSGESMPEKRRQAVVDAAQSVAEGIRRDRHRGTRGYNRAISQQRVAVLAHRERVERGTDATEPLRTLIPEQLDALSRATGPVLLDDTIRAVTLFYLDECWADHLADLQELRDGIHLRALAGQDPETAFHLIALQRFQPFFDDVDERAAAVVAALTPEQVGSPIDDLGLVRPSATWTYMITDNPLGSADDRAARALGRIWRSRVLRIE